MSILDSAYEATVDGSCGLCHDLIVKGESIVDMALVSPPTVTICRVHEMCAQEFEQGGRPTPPPMTNRPRG